MPLTNIEVKPDASDLKSIEALRQCVNKSLCDQGYSAIAEDFLRQTESIPCRDYMINFVRKYVHLKSDNNETIKIRTYAPKAHSKKRERQGMAKYMPIIELDMDFYTLEPLFETRSEALKYAQGVISAHNDAESLRRAILSVKPQKA